MLTKTDGTPMDCSPIDSFSMDARKTLKGYVITYWVRGGELLNVWMAYYEPNSAEFETDEGDWFPVDHGEIERNMSDAFKDDVRLDDVLAVAAAVKNPSKWGLYDRDAFEF
ncbi:MAG: salicylate hydroxylase [Gammaproteobacteria bacterium]|jgi:salicylate hydroxylase